MLSTLKKRKSDKANIDQQLYNAIYRKVTKEKHNYPSPQKGDKTITECIEFFKAGADPNILSELEKSLIGQEKYQKYYIKNFLPALLQEIIQSEKLGLEKIDQILRITSDIVKQSNEYEHYIQFLETLLGEIRESSASCKDDKKKEKLQKIGKIITEIISGSNYQIDLRNSQINGQDNAGTPKPSDGQNPPVPSEKNPPSSPVSGRRDSISATLSSVEEDGHPQKEEFEQQKQNPEEEPKIPVSATLMTDDDHTKDPVKSKETERKNTIVQKPFANENNSEDTPPEKQPNNRNFRIALATCCALSVGCLVTGVVTLGMVGAGLLVMSVVFAIAAVTRYLPPPSSELTSTDLSPLIDDSKQR